MSEAEVDALAAIYFSVSATFLIELSIPDVEERTGVDKVGFKGTFWFPG